MLYLIGTKAFGIHTFSCGTYLVRGTLELHKERGFLLVISEGTYSETSLYPEVSEKLKSELPKLPHKGQFTIAVNSKETVKENVDLLAWDIAEDISGEIAPSDVIELKKSACTKAVNAPDIIEAKYPDAPIQY